MTKPIDELNSQLQEAEDEICALDVCARASVFFADGSQLTFARQGERWGLVRVWGMDGGKEQTHPILASSKRHRVEAAALLPKLLAAILAADAAHDSAIEDAIEDVKKFRRMLRERAASDRRPGEG